MYKWQVIISSLMLMLSLSSALASTLTVEEMLVKADSYRLSSDTMKVDSEIIQFQDDKQKAKRQYSVYVRPHKQSLVLFTSPAEAGQKMLMLDDNYWLVMPKSRRPIRITPMQKLLGEASIGDIATLTWSQDFKARWLEYERIIDRNGEGQDTYKLELTAHRAGLSYQRITLWLEDNTYFPIKADLYLRSGKLAKQAWFIEGIYKGEPWVETMILVDNLFPNRRTEVHYLSVEQKALADKYYNPSFLARVKQVMP